MYITNLISPILLFSPTDVEDYLEVLQTENLSAKARLQKDEILSDIKQLKERFAYSILCSNGSNFCSAIVILKLLQVILNKTDTVFSGLLQLEMLRSTKTQIWPVSCCSWCYSMLRVHFNSTSLSHYG